MYYPYYGKKSQVQHAHINNTAENIQTNILYIYLGKQFSLNHIQWFSLFYSVSLALLQVNYSQPLVAIKFLNITKNEDVNVECRINANNIPEGTERDKFAGRVSFKLRVNSI